MTCLFLIAKISVFLPNHKVWSGGGSQIFDLWDFLAVPFGLLFLPHTVPIPKQCVKLKIINLCQSGYFGFSLWEDQPHSCDVYADVYADT